ncbi:MULTISPECIES: DUF3757 domain-containing protein [Pseudomonas syringae group genomosp. 2]|uniref:DUF3757 domain-containing protein n=3 Tax=Pseudomonas syringae group genomosp. 2 TaxID=251698 RepID=A0AAX1VSY5_PSEAJ|nr:MULTISPECIES: DUF3757 domain-containing protein [Pseudomonas syringae group genomosp. 2]KPX76606.1 Uncharacterized protein ALO35_04171 [Pseudomonas amygdali pv. lachrymans]KEZ28969.1 hypothetical protein A3SK_0101760 [Pseudomonas amygdali pv. tabaci str. 6605]KIY16312.1 hypothetical protein RD00_20515 [Pseudomonas amygdali pv. tabaci]KPY81934.1 Uncharacterized protein ALO60_03257 [Pseudomonas amygdali pv. tabaci]RML79884.1 hypothetical protein ALQ89_03211 [Pseudomonas amygdali pv. tabaci]
MKKVLISAAIATCLLGMSMTSQAAENCPAVEKIEQVSPGVYRASGNDGEWTGVLQGVVKKKMHVQSFELAIAIQESADAPQMLQYCTYNIGGREMLDMRFTAKNNKDFTVKTAGSIWKKENGFLGLVYNVCEKTSPENCKFTVVK